jgi:hypothetical protein
MAKSPFFGLRLLAIVMLAFVWLADFGHCDACLCLSRKTNKGKHHNGQEP